MTATLRAPGRFGLGSVGEYGSVGFTPLHWEGNPSPGLVTVCLSVPMSADDLVAALWSLIYPDLNEPDLIELETDPEFVHEIVCESLCAFGVTALDDTRTAMLTTTDLYAQQAVARLYAVVTRLYGPADVSAVPGGFPTDTATVPAQDRHQTATLAGSW